MVNAMFKWVTPNQLTLTRILSVPVLLALLYVNNPVGNFAAFLVFFFACLTDYWDGVLARQRGEVTQMGKLLDPIADKVLIISSLIMLVWIGVAGVLPTILITAREFAVAGLRSVAATEGIVIAAAPGAKWKTVLQMVAVGLLMVHHSPFSVPVHVLGQAMLWIATAWTLWTGYAYFADYFKRGH